MPMFTRPSNWDGAAASSSLYIRPLIRPTLCQSIRMNWDTTLWLLYTESQQVVSSKFRVKPESCLAQGTAATRTPCFLQHTLGVSASTKTFWPPKSTLLQRRTPRPESYFFAFRPQMGQRQAAIRLGCTLSTNWSWSASWYRSSNTTCSVPINTFTILLSCTLLTPFLVDSFHHTKNVILLLGWALCCQRFLLVFCSTHLHEEPILNVIFCFLLAPKVKYVLIPILF